MVVICLLEAIRRVYFFFFEALEGDVLVEGQQPSNCKDDGEQSEDQDEEAVDGELGIGLLLIVSADDLVPSDRNSHEGYHKGLVEDNGHVVQ